MSEAVKEYVKFNVLGIEKDLVTQEDKDRIYKLTQKKNILKKALEQDKYFVIESYNITTRVDIFNGLKLRQGMKCRITFISGYGYPVEIKGAEIGQNNKILLTCIFCKTRKVFKMWLDTFLSEYRNGIITKVKPDGFVKYYLSSISDGIKAAKAELDEIYNKYNKIYNDTKNQLENNYLNELSKTNKVVKEAKSNRYQMTSDEALEKAKSFKGLERVKDYWNSKITEEEKQSLLNWISQNIYSIRVYGLINGQSGNTLLNEYADVGAIKMRPVKTNEEGKVTS